MKSALAFAAALSTPAIAIVLADQVRISPEGIVTDIPDIPDPKAKAIYNEIANDAQSRSEYDAENVSLEFRDANVDAGETELVSLQNTHFYHSTDGIHNKIAKLEKSCEHAQVSMDTHEKSAGNYSVAIDVVNINAKGDTWGAGHKQKFFGLFGEHAREMISPESALHFIEGLCSGKYSSTLVHTDFTIIPNGNPNSRREVEQGDVCRRVNPRGTDLNRNWDEHFDEGAVGFSNENPDTNPGKAPFSEPETQIFHEVLGKDKYDGFLSIHSGTLGMYQPWAYDNTKLDQTKNGRHMFHILQELDADVCKCPFGAAGKEVGYSCPGTCLDYAYEHAGCSYAFAFEIYAGHADRESLRTRWEQKMEQIHEDQMKNNRTDFEQQPVVLAQMASEIFRDHPSHFVQMKNHNIHPSFLEEGKIGAEAGGFCEFEQFNPTTKDEFDKTLEDWSGAYMKLVNLVYDAEHGEGSAKSLLVTKEGEVQTE